jgi:flagellar biosynthesis/type III secretory pathway protein FliH
MAVDVMAWFDKNITELQEVKTQVVEDLAVKREEGRLEGDGTGYERGFKEGKVVGYNEGLAENENIPDGVFTEQELQNAKAEGEAAGRAAMQPQIDELSQKLSALQVEFDGLKAASDAKDGEHKEAIKALKIGYAAKIRDTQVDDLALASEMEAEANS